MYPKSNLKRINQLRIESASLDPSANDRKTLTDRLLQHVEEFLEHVDAKTFVEPTSGIRQLSERPFPEAPENADLALELLKRYVDTEGVAVTSPNFFAYIPAGGLYYAALADFMAAAINRYAGWSGSSPGAARIEHKVVRWLGEVIGYGDTDSTKFGGTLTSGGTIATLIAVIVARDQRLLSTKLHKTPVLYKTAMTHKCLDKALHIAGLGHIHKRNIQTDDNYCMSIENLEHAIQEDLAHEDRVPWMVVGSAGNVNTGSVDPLSGIARICRKYNLWFHVDGAYGGLFRLCLQGAEVLKGMEASDSVVVDPHKSLFLPYGTGAVLVKDSSFLHQSFRDFDAFYANGNMAEREHYLPAEEEDPDAPIQAHVSPELTRPFRGLRVWLSLQLAGVNSFRAALAEKMELARYFHSRLKQEPDFEVIGEHPDLSIIAYRYRPSSPSPESLNKLNEQLTEELQRNGEIYVTNTRLVRGGSEQAFLRFAILSFRSHLEHVERAVDIITHTARNMKTCT